jgi:shikimate kinase
MIVEASGHATAKVIQTQLDKSCAYALDLNSKASAELSDKSKTVTGNAPAYAKDLAKKTLKAFGFPEYGLSLKIDSSIPANAGLGEKEADSVATVLAVTAALAKKHGAINQLKIDKYVREQYMTLGGELVDKKKLLDMCPGEFDRVFTGLYGGFAVCDNRKKEVLRRGEMETVWAVAASPKKKTILDKDWANLYRHESELIWEECLKGNIYTAIRLGGLLYRDTLAPKMLRAGAFTAGASYPSAIALTRNEKQAKKVEASVKKEAKTLIIRTANEQSAALVKPKRIVKAREFVEEKGEQDYFFL